MGQLNPNLNPRLENALVEFTEKTGAVVLHEHLSNLFNPQFCRKLIDMGYEDALNSKAAIHTFFEIG